MLAGIALCLAAWGASLITVEPLEGATGVVFLGRGDCTGVADDSKLDERCSVELVLSRSLPELTHEATISLRSLELTHAVDGVLAPCDTVGAGDRNPAPVSSGLPPCSLGSEDVGLSIQAGAGASLGVIRAGLLSDPAPTTAPHQLALFATAAGHMALVERTSARRTSEVLCLPGPGSLLKVLRRDGTPREIPLPPNVATRLVARSPGDLPARINLSWDQPPGTLWRGLRLTSFAGPVALASEYDWQGNHYTLGYGRMQLASRELTADVSQACDGNCFKLAFSSDKPTEIVTMGGTAMGRSVVSARWFQSLAAVLAFVLSVLELFKGKDECPKADKSAGTRQA